MPQYSELLRGKVTERSLIHPFLSRRPCTEQAEQQPIRTNNITQIQFSAVVYTFPRYATECRNRSVTTSDQSLQSSPLPHNYGRLQQLTMFYTTLSHAHNLMKCPTRVLFGIPPCWAVVNHITILHSSTKLQSSTAFHLTLDSPKRFYNILHYPAAFYNLLQCSALPYNILQWSQYSTRFQIVFNPWHSYTALQQK